MKVFMKKNWCELTNYISKEQSFLIFLYLAFTAYFKNMEIGTEIKAGETGKIQDLKMLREIFKGVPGYDLKRAANDLEESIAWEMFESVQPCKKIARELKKNLEYCVKSCDDLEERIAELEVLVSELDSLTFTPKSVNQFLAEMPVNKGTTSIAELYCGLSGTGLAVLDKLSCEKGQIRLTGEEQRKLYCDISRIRMFCHGIDRPEVLQRDILEEESEETFDLVIADLPKGNNESVYVGNQESFLGDKSRVFVEWVAIQKILNRVNENGKAMIIVTKGALVRQREKSIREILTEKDWLEAVITLPANMYASTHLGFEVLVLNKNKPKANREKVFLADISGKKNNSAFSDAIPQEVTEKLKCAYGNLESIPLFSAVVSLKEIEEKDFSWNPFLYLRLREHNAERRDTIELGEIAEIGRGAQIPRGEEQILSEHGTHYWLNIRNLGDGEIFFDEQSMIRPKSSDWEEKFGIREDDIILTSKGAAMKVCIVDGDMPKAFLCGNLTRLRVNQEKYSPYVLYEFLNSEEGRAVLESIQSGTTIKVLSNANLMKLPVPVYDGVLEKGERLKWIYQEYHTAEKAVKSKFEADRKQVLEALQRYGKE